MNTYDEVSPAVNWPPEWVTEDNNIGIAIDDHCFVVVIKSESNNWLPTKHIPKVAAELISKLVHSQL